MKVLGITGGIGSGKSTVCQVFRQLGIPVYEADAEVKKLYQSDTTLVASLRARFPADLFNEEGRPDTSRFAAYFFNQPAALEQLNALVHPPVKEHFRKWTKENRQSPYVIKEAAILFESGTDKDCDRVATVAAPEEMRIARVVNRDKRSRSEVMKIIQKQWSDAQRKEKADYEICNDEKQLVLPQLLNVHRQMLKLAGE
jgi:dephospho-CoA kinase